MSWCPSALPYSRFPVRTALRTWPGQTLSILRGLALYLTQGYSIPINNVPGFFTIGRGEIVGFPVPALIAIGVALLGYAVITTTKYGRQVVAVGSNMEAARRVGMPAKRRRAGGSEPLPCNPGFVDIHPRVSLSETTAPGISATVVRAPTTVAGRCRGGTSRHAHRINNLTQASPPA